jgi:two-component system response regulator FlrC
MARILVADDEDGIRLYLAQSLELDGHTVAQAEDGEAALRLVAEQAFDLLITDLRMPNVDGMTLVRSARAQQPEMEVVVLTAHGAVETAVEAMKLGAFDYLQKPIASPAQIRLIAARALERRQLLNLREQAAREAADEPPLTYGDPAMAPVVDALQKVSATDATVLLVGESGTGKEVAARALHRWSRRAAGPFVAVNCAALAESLIESELFGHEKGAFTGATDRRRGRIELADGGTFFFDEIGELKPALQAKLLRVLETRAFERVGGARAIGVDVRWVAATNRDLAAMMKDGGFRVDLYHRLAGFPIRLPPLRSRRTDILPLTEALLTRACAALGVPRVAVDDEARAALVRAAWPGNIRELANVIERAVILSAGAPVGPEHLMLEVAPETSAEAPGTLAALERAAIEHALNEMGGNRRLAADRLGIGLRTLYDKLKRYGLD